MDILNHSHGEEIPRVWQRVLVRGEQELARSWNHIASGISIAFVANETQKSKAPSRGQGMLSKGQKNMNVQNLATDAQSPAASHPILVGRGGFTGERPERSVISVRLMPMARVRIRTSPSSGSSTSTLRFGARPVFRTQGREHRVSCDSSCVPGDGVSCFQSTLK
jgi:hypothetical protein